jgi:hypothetical protein
MHPDLCSSGPSPSRDQATLFEPEANTEQIARTDSAVLNAVLMSGTSAPALARGLSRPLAKIEAELAAGG